MRFLKNRLFTGTLILTAAGFSSRILGFFYRMFLSQTFGEEKMGIYQLLTPIIVLSYSLAVSGIETSVSKYVAECGDVRSTPLRPVILKTGIFFSLSMSILTGFFLFEYADPISVHFLLEKRCAGLIRIYAISLPLSAIHGCINGYYFGLKKTGLPAFSQLLEQLMRIITVFFLCRQMLSKGSMPSIAIAAVGLVVGELSSAVFCLFFIWFQNRKVHPFPSASSLPQVAILRKILLLSLPLTMNRLILNLFHSIESVSIPNRLLLSGLSGSDALSLYGVLTGMALPLILVPSTLTNSLSVLLLPYISEADSLNRTNRIISAFRKCVFGCLALGVACGIFFYATGNLIGTLLFHSEKAGVLIRALSFLCPFLYLGNVLTSILHGLGKAGSAFAIQLLTLSIRLLFVFFSIPLLGIRGYLLGLFFSQLVFCFLIFIALREYLYYNKNVL
jgi:stage V sporulation protein B